MTPAERTEKARVKNRLKSAKRRARKRAEKRKEWMANRHKIELKISKTCPSYRRRLPPVPEMILKSELRAFLAEAVRNTEPR